MNFRYRRHTCVALVMSTPLTPTTHVGESTASLPYASLSPLLAHATRAWLNSTRRWCVACGVAVAALPRWLVSLVDALMDAGVKGEWVYTVDAASSVCSSSLS